MEKDSSKVDFDTGVVMPDFTKEITREQWILAVFPEWGTYLNKKISEYQVPKGQVSMWWCGCAAWVVKTDEGGVFCIDLASGPSGTTHFGQCGVCRQSGAASIDWMRLQPQVIDPWSFERIDGCFISHIHADHCDPWSISAILRTSDTKFYGPKLVADWIPRFNVPKDRIVAVEVGDVIKLPGANVHILVNYDQTAIQTVSNVIMDYNDCCVSFLFETSAGNILFLGDTWYSDGYVQIPNQYPIDVATFNIGFNAPGGTDKMTPYDAARLGIALKAKVLIPDHYDYWHNIAGDPNLLIDQFERIVGELAPYIKTVIMRGGGRFDYPKDQDIKRYWYPDESEKYRFECSAIALEAKKRAESKVKKV